MKILKESKQEKLPIDFITQFISKSWEEVGNIKASIDGIHHEFSGTKVVENILQDLVDAYLVAIGQLELHLDKKDYIELPEEESKSINESLNECDENITEETDSIKTQDYTINVEQDNNELEIEITQTDDDWPEPDLSDVSDIKAAKAAINTGAFNNNSASLNDTAIDTSIQNINNNDDDYISIDEIQKEVDNTEANDLDFIEVDFPEIEPDLEADNAIHAWLNKHKA